VLIQILVPLSDGGVDKVVSIGTGDDFQHLFPSSLLTEVELERDTSSRSSETCPPSLLKDLSSVCV